LVSGRDFILKIPADPPSLWGEGNRVAWAEGEGLVIYAPQGAGKTSLAQQLVNARIGIGPSHLLGLPVEQTKGKLLYLAMDRPPQIARSWRRMVNEEDSELLAERVVVWQGPLPFKLTPDEPEKLVRWAVDEIGCTDAIVIDSYKNLAPNLSDEKTGAMIDSVAQETLAEGIGWVALHHGRKANSDNKKPNTLDDVYGSGWLTAGMGSVLCLWGKPGDSLVELTHLKQPAEPVGPLMVMHDHATGQSKAVHVPPGRPPRQREILAVFAQKGGTGTTLKLSDLKHLGGDDDSATRRALKKLEDLGTLIAEGHTSNKTWTLAG
jgi:replicative DNA helicase